MARVKYIDRDRGWRKLKREMERTRLKPHTVVGIFGSKASEPHGDLDNAGVGSVHEFGLGNVPERSFIRTTIDGKARQIHAMARRAAHGVLDRRATLKQGLELLGAFVKGEIQKRMARGIPPPLKPATIARKGSSKPLIDTGQLRASIDYEVRNT